MPKTRPPYASECQQQMVKLIRTGRDAQDLASEFELPPRRSGTGSPKLIAETADEIQS